MRKNIFIIVIGLLMLGMMPSQLKSQNVIDSLTTPDPNIRKYFPRWKVCENDIRIQIHQSFVVLGVDKSLLDMSNIEVIAAPRIDQYVPYDLLTITCGKATMNANVITSAIPRLAEYLNGSVSFLNGYELYPPKRDYCYNEIAPETPMDQTQAKAILSYMEPSNVDHSITVSLFEQTLKVGSSDFWLKNIIGNDPIGYPFWNSGEAKVVLKRPLYVNGNEESRDRIPNLINAQLGVGYRLESGLYSDEVNALSWVTRRKLNSGPDVKIIAGFDFHIPFYPEIGISVNAEIPTQKLKNKDFDRTYYASYNAASFPNLNYSPGEKSTDFAVVPFLRGSGQVALFYNWWLNKEKGENYFRFDLGISYFEVREMLSYFDGNKHTFTMTQDAEGLQLYKPNEFGDWVFAKVEYRNQAIFPFGMSVQYSNQILLGKLYIPIFKWLYIEGKAAVPLRHFRYFENQTFFMVSPTLRITL